MACDVIRGPDGTIFLCNRSVRRARCSVPGCGKPAGYECDFPLRGRKAGATCSKKICEDHRAVQGPDVDYCPAHNELARREAAQVPIRKDDVTPGWQARAAALAEIIRTCQHAGEPGVNADGVPFCLECGRHFEER